MGMGGSWNNEETLKAQIISLIMPCLFRNCELEHTFIRTCDTNLGSKILSYLKEDHNSAILKYILC